MMTQEILDKWGDPVSEEELKKAAPYVFSPRANPWGDRPKADPDKCAASVQGVGFTGNSQCQNKPKHDEAGHKWCGVHRPLKSVNRDRAYRREWREKDRVRDLNKAVTDAKEKIARTAVLMFDQKASMDDLEQAVIDWRNACREAGKSTEVE